VRSRVAIALLGAALACLLVALLSESTEHRLVGFVGAILLGGMYLAERQRPNPP